ncbi:hypothetical protein KS4_23630 [Poriferisphaera corsica]|uniref:Uncharacterized protein n=1 Tax=Poriferisphaera corsica TaxID=2528020 RepID=A0A517YVQ9_9BACT|nr:hypothetical protein [Poriferisphaera corsica]QDU34296.1 hypothetical protein KS4_23630 [Poriferisphaera corsica]
MSSRSYMNVWKQTCDAERHADNGEFEEALDCLTLACEEHGGVKDGEHHDSRLHIFFSLNRVLLLRRNAKKASE